MTKKEAIEFALLCVMTVRDVIAHDLGSASRTSFLAVAISPGASIAEIAEKIGRTHTIASRALSELMRKGLVTIEQDSENRRRHLVRLTSKGETCVDRLAQVFMSIR